MTLFKSQKLQDADARIVELEAENATLAENLTASNTRLEELSGANERIIELETANAEIPSMNATIAAHEAKITALEADVIISNEKISLAAAQLLASQGHQAPVNLEGETPEDRPKTSNLSGYEKIRAKFAK